MKKLLMLIAGVFISSTVFASIIHLKDGKEINGSILEKDEKSVKIDVSGVTMTYYMDEIQDIDGQKGSVKEDPAKKRELILKFIDVFGTRTAMARNFDSMLASLAQEKPEDAKKIKEKFKADEVVERLVPLYDKYFTSDDLKGYIDFYSSPKGKKLVSSIGLIMKDSIDVGAVYLKEKFPEMANN